MDTYSYVPDGVNGGTQVAMGQPLELLDYYLISSSAPIRVSRDALAASLDQQTVLYIQ